jgi:UDPglucose 6-dehydrogenase
VSRVAIVGTGYVGLTTGAYLAHIGHEVTCVDVVADKVERLNRGDVPIFEAGLEELVRAGLDSGRLRFVLGSEAAIAGVEFVFLCLPTPQGDDGSADLSYIEQAATEIGPLLDAESIVINKSTVPVGSTRLVQRALGRDDVSVVSNPEFLREGSALHDALNPDRIVIGADDAAAASRVAALFNRINAPLIVTDPASAELIKYASNAFLATKISYVNAIANLCEAVGADVREVVLGMGYDKRIGFEFLRPGPGWGGSCFHPDETLLVRRGDDVRLLTFAELFDEVERVGPTGWEALSWDPAGVGPEFRSIAVFTKRDYDGIFVEARTKMGRRIRTTADHPFVCGDGRPEPRLTRKLASALTDNDWLPLASGFPDLGWEDCIGLPLSSLADAGLSPGQVIVRAGEQLRGELADRQGRLPAGRRRDILRCGALRLSELADLGIDLDDPERPLSAGAGTTTNGTYVPAQVPMDEEFWRVIGLYLAEGSIVSDGARRRIVWHFHPTKEDDLVETVRAYFERLGVRTSVHLRATSKTIAVSSRILAAWFEHGLGVGTNCYNKAIPDAVWGRPDSEKAALLRGLWDGDGSKSLVRGGPSVVYEYGTASARLADGMLRLLGDLGLVARLRVGRGAKSTVDTYWLCLSGAAQVERALWLFPEDEQREIVASIGRQAKRIAPTGYRLAKNAAWVRVVSTQSSAYRGPVYSVEVPGPHTVVVTAGLVTSNCFPKDTKALVRIAEGAGYDFGLLEGVITVNIEQYDRIADKIEANAHDGSLQGRTVAVWGLTFKARTDDLRDSPALAVISKLRDRGAVVRAFDPTVHGDRMQDARLAGIELVTDPYAACDGADLIALLTEWDEFRWLDFDKVRGLLASPVIVDARNLLDPAALRRRGFSYVGVGRP